MRSGIRLSGYIQTTMGLLESLGSSRDTGRITKAERLVGLEEEVGSSALTHLEKKSEVSRVAMICFWREAIAGARQRVGGGLEAEQGTEVSVVGVRVHTGPLRPSRHPLHDGTGPWISSTYRMRRRASESTRTKAEGMQLAPLANLHVATHSPPNGPALRPEARRSFTTTARALAADH